MDGFTVHSIPGSPFGRSVLIALHEKSAPYRFARVPPAALRAPEHLARHAFARVPVLEHGDFVLYETQAILRYLDRVLPQPPLTPADPRAAARMDQLMNINDWYLFHGVGNVIAFQRIVGPKLLGLTADEAAIAAALPKARRVLAELSALLADQPWFAGAAPTLADALLAPQLEYMAQTPEWRELGAPHPNLDRWLARMQARPSMVATTMERVAAMASATTLSSAAS